MLTTTAVVQVDHLLSAVIEWSIPTQKKEERKKVSRCEAYLFFLLGRTKKILYVFICLGLHIFLVPGTFVLEGGGGGPSATTPGWQRFRFDSSDGSCDHIKEWRGKTKIDWKDPSSLQIESINGSG